MTKLLVISDLHREYDRTSATCIKVDAVVLAGDIDVHARGIRWAAQTFPDCPVIYVPGNHEYYGALRSETVEMMQQAAVGTSVQLLNPGVTIAAGVLFIGATLWTDYALDGEPIDAMTRARTALADHHAIAERRIASGRTQAFMPEDALAAFGADRDFLKGALRARKPHQTSPTVVVTHHAPSGKSVHPMYADSGLNACFASNLEGLISKYRPKLWLHGHMHRSVDYALEGCRVIANPRGYPWHVKGEFENPEFNPNLIVEI